MCNWIGELKNSTYKSKTHILKYLKKKGQF